MGEINSVRQGDVAFFRITEIPEIPEGYEKTDQTILEVHGERGGHIHRVAGVEVYQQSGAAAVAERPATDTDEETMIPVAVIKAFEEKTVTHDVLGDNERPHNDQTLPPGTWEVRQARQRSSRPVD